MYSKQLIENQEGFNYKFVDSNANVFSSSSTGVVTPINGIATGTSFFNRVGNTVCNKYVRLFGQGISTNNYTFLYLVYDRQFNGTIPNFSDIFQCTNNVGTNASTYLSFNNVNNSNRFSILWYKKMTNFVASPFGVCVYGSHTFQNNILTNATNGAFFDDVIDCCDLYTSYSNNTGSTSAISTGALLFCSIGDTTTSVTASYRICYTDV